MQRNVLIGGAAVAVLLLVGYFLWPRTHAITNYPSAGTDLIAFGDSLVAGQGSTEGHDLVSLLSKEVGQNILNLGVPGNTTAQGLERLSELDKYHPKVVLLLLGGNDYLKRVPPTETFENLGKIIADLQKRGAVVLLLGVRGGVLKDHFAGEYEKLSKQYGTAYISNVLDGLLGDPKYMSDEVHPNDAGYARIAARVGPVLSSLIH